MKIAIDMDNTLFDEFGKDIRPGVVRLLTDLKADGHLLVLWTNSTRARARQILGWHDFEKYFSQFLFREDYDRQNSGAVKDLRRIDGDALIDDDAKQIRAAKAAGRIGIQVSPFRGGATAREKEMEQVYRHLGGRSRDGVWGRITSLVKGRQP